MKDIDVCTLHCAILRKPYLMKHRGKGKRGTEPQKESIVESTGEVPASCGNTWRCKDCL